MKQLLIFPPGWSLNVGNPHPALPLLKAVLEKDGVDVRIRDFNWEIAEYYEVRITSKDAIESVEVGTTEAMNTLYFNAEDKLMEVAKSYNGEWNLQLGFKFNDLSFYSSKDVREALKLDSPFTEYFKRETLPWVDKEDPEIIGFSVTSIYQMIPALHLSWMLRKAGYGGFIVFGGNTISRLKEEIIKKLWLFDLVDGFIIFQGESPFLRFSKAIRAGGDFSNVPNLIWRDNGAIKENLLIQYQDPDLIPPPDFGELPLGRYWGVNYLPLLAARGCYYAKCNFCGIPYGYGEGGFGGVRDAGLVFKDIITLMNKYDMQKYKFMDEALSPKTLTQLSDLILNGAVQVEWEGYLRLERLWLDKAFINRLGRSGFKKGYFGLEIYPEETRANLRKNDSAKEILAVLENCNDAGIKVHLFCMFGFPGTGRKEAENTIKFILKHNDLIDTVDLNAYTYARHTSVFGIEKIVKNDQDWAIEYEYQPTSEGILSSKEVEELANEMQEIVWTECPRLIHPIYRLVSPWKYIHHIQGADKGYVLSVVH